MDEKTGTLHGGISGDFPPLHPHCYCWLEPLIGEGPEPELIPEPQEVIPTTEEPPAEGPRNVDPSEMRALFQSWHDNLSDEETNAIFDYTGATYGDLNRNLRNLKPIDEWNEKTRITHDGLLSALEIAPRLQEDTILHRQLFSSDLYTGGKLGKIHEGDIIPDRAFMSTSVDPHFIPPDRFGLVYEIEAPKGTKGLFIGYKDLNPAFWAKESEFILPPGTRLKVQGYEETGEQIRVRMRIVP